MTDHELQLKAIALRHVVAGPAFQPEGLRDISRGLRSVTTTPPVRVHRLSTTLKGSQSRMRANILAPLLGAADFVTPNRGYRVAQPPANFFHGFTVNRAGSALIKPIEEDGARNELSCSRISRGSRLKFLVPIHNEIEQP
jgi:hypothetical protein